MPPFLVLVYIIKMSLSGGTTASAPLADTTQDGLLRKVSGNTTDFVDGTNHCQGLVAAIQPTIWSARLRSFNTMGNPNFEVDQRNAGAGTSTPGQFAQDRWYRGGVLNYSAMQTGGNPIVIPGTNFAITRAIQRLTLLTQKASLAAGDLMYMHQWLEGPVLRELINDAHSISLLVRSSVANVVFGIALRDNASTYTLTKLCTGGAANTWTLIQLPNLPVWTPSATWLLTPGSVGYVFDICLACGSTNLSLANDTWQSGNFTGAIGQGNFAASPVNSTFDIAFIQHEPGPVCSTLIDKPFSQNLDECLRYYAKSYSYAVAPGTVSAIGQCAMYCPASLHPVTPIRFKKTMAKAPTVTGYSPVSGAINNLRDNTAVLDKAINGVSSVGDDGFSGFTVTSPNAAAWQSLSHYTADTGW